MIIYEANTRKAKHWRETRVSWDELCDRLSTTVRTPETIAAYKQMSKDEQSDIKDVGGFVGGVLRDGRRKKDSVISRSLLTLDIDFGKPDTVSDLEDNFPYAYCVYSTHKHTPENPRLRLVIPLNRLITDSDEYQALGRKVAEYIGIDLFDSTTYDASRLMYWPSSSIDGEYIYVKSESRKALPVDEWLAKYFDWRNVAEWPTSAKENKVRTRSLVKQQDPVTKDGVIGAFCRLYPISRCIESYLSDFYEPCGEGRYTFKGGTTHGGAVCYEDKWLYSYHDTDPANEQLCNSFDLVRIHLFGEADVNTSADTPTCKLPSYTACQEFLLRDEEIKRQTIIADSGFHVVTEGGEEVNGKTNDSWVSALSTSSSGAVKPTLENCELILNEDEEINHIRYNELEGLCEATKDLPWSRIGKFWSDSDDASLLSYMNNKYGVFFPDRVYHTAFLSIVSRRRYNPIKDYLSHLPVWDGVERVDNLLIKYLGADDSEYVRAVTRKLLVAAVKRIYQPGCKFDNILVIQGPEGIGKSTLIAKLGGEWFSDSVSMSDTRDMKVAAEKIKGSWILEFSELKGMRDSSAEAVKSFLSRQDDRYRAAYGRNVESHPRQCVFFGTTNNDGYINDPTGSRRFWPVSIEGKKEANSWDITEEERAQIWAEVLVRYKQEEPLTLSPEIEREANMRRREAVDLDARAQTVAEYLDILLPSAEEWAHMTDFQRTEFIRNHNDPNNSLVAQYNAVRLRDTVTIAEVWVECFGKKISDIRRQDETNIGLIMKSITGWSKRRVSTGNGRNYAYVRVKPEDEDYLD